MERKLKHFTKNVFIFTFLAFFLLGVLYFSPTYGGPEVLGVKPPTSQRHLEDINNINENDDNGEEISEHVVDPSGEEGLPISIGEVDSTAKEAVSFRKAVGFDDFNAQYQNQWKASFSKKTGKVKNLYGFSSKRYEDGPENVAMSFLKDSHNLFGLKPDISDLKVKQVNKTSVRNHIRLQQTYHGVPVDRVFVLVHSNKENQVTMVQNSYIPDFQVANEERIGEEQAKDIAQNDLRTSLGDNAMLSDPKAEKLIIPKNKEYYYCWKITISTRKPLGYWVYHVDAENGQILYKGNEIHSLKIGRGWAFTSNADYHRGRISNVSLKNMFTSSETADWGYLFGTHAMIFDYNGNDPWAYNYRFTYDPGIQKDWFDATTAYYKLNTIRDWWDKNVVKKYVNNEEFPEDPNYVPYFSDNYPIPTYVNAYDDCACNAFYTSDFLGDGSGYPGFCFGNDDTCTSGSEDLVIDDDVVRHEYTHAMMDWLGFDVQFGGEINSYGRSMGEGNADFFAFLNTPDDPLIGDVAFALTPEYMRNLNNTRMYPGDVEDPDLGAPEEHYTGEIWGGYLYDLYRLFKGKALKYIFQSFYYFDPSSGHVSGESDFVDGVYAQYLADKDISGGKVPSTIKAYGLVVSRGFNNVLRDAYDTDEHSGLIWVFPPTKSINTKGNFFHDGDVHEYLVRTENPGMDLTVTATAKRGGLIDPAISLYSTDGYLWTSVSSISSTKAVLNWPDLIPGDYVIMVSGTATVPGRSYYNIDVTLQ